MVRVPLANRAVVKAAWLKRSVGGSNEFLSPLVTLPKKVNR